MALNHTLGPISVRQSHPQSIASVDTTKGIIRIDGRGGSHFVRVSVIPPLLLSIIDVEIKRDGNIVNALKLESPLKTSTSLSHFHCYFIY